MAEFKSHIIKLDGDVWHLAILVPQKIAKAFVTKENRRVVCIINGNHSFQCALMPSGNGDFFINVNKVIRTKLDLKSGDSVSIKLEKDTSEYGLPLPDELKAAWELDEEGHRVFHNLTPGKQRTLIHILGKPKSSEIRVTKALAVLEYLKSVNGKLDFKELNLALKNASNP
ncbi:MAG: hypothetical protein COA58_14725 [Bacteroidetes bacterium]|nr:MAG: hypothetical protein COA58_14725 [Bacteroidota bacterium]